jgi:hypothetical protein
VIAGFLDMEHLGPSVCLLRGMSGCQGVRLSLYEGPDVVLSTAKCLPHNLACWLKQGLEALGKDMRGLNCDLSSTALIHLQ